MAKHFFTLLLFYCCHCVATANDSLAVNQKYVIINNVSISGNNRTKEKIILRELSFKKGDTISVEKIDAHLRRTEFNIMNTSLFNFVRADTIPFYQRLVDIHIDVKERWYIFPIPIFEVGERNFNTWLESPDLNRASYGFYLSDENFRGLKENLSLKIRLGYAEQYGLSYTIPFINKKQTSGISVGAFFNRNHEIWYRTSNNKIIFYKHPDEYIRKEYVARIAYSHRGGLYNNQSIELRYVNSFIGDTVLRYTPDYLLKNETQMQLFILTAGFNMDHRDWKTYPLKGYYIGADISKQGLGLLPDENVNFMYLNATYRHYFKLAPKFYASGMLRGKLSSPGFQPYYIQRALGYGDYVRGYQLYVIDGQNYFLAKANFRYELIKPRVLHIKYIPSEKFNTIPYAFYLTAYSDFGYVQDNYTYRNNPLANNWLAGCGVGIDFVSYYDSVLRFEYAVNRMGEDGFYLHMSAAF